MTSKPVRGKDEPGHAGYGLYVVSELAVRNGGTFRITSGGESLVLFRRAWRRESMAQTHAPWPGTIVCVLLDLTNLLPIGEVYETLPLPEGWDEAEDFFDA